MWRQQALAILLLVWLCSLAGCSGNAAARTKFVTIPPGDFQMGSPLSEHDRFDNETPHRVLTRSFEIAATPVTVDQFARFVHETGYQTTAEKEGWAYGAWNARANRWDKLRGASWRHPGFPQPQRDDHPVVDVTWFDAVAYCLWLSANEHRSYRLPTEAEWESACRAGTVTAYPWGDDPACVRGHANGCDASAKDLFNLFPPFDWSDGYRYTSPVAHFKPNAWGLYDMIGNTLEWCSDYFAKYPTGDVIDPTGPSRGKQRVLRGGAFVYGPKHCRSAFRGRNDPDFRNFYIGFRVVRELPAIATTSTRPEAGS